MDEMNHLATQYNPALVAISWAVALFAAYSALSTINRLRQGDSNPQWILSGAIAFGLGVWAMHFIGMAALRIHDTSVGYDIGITVFSGVFSIVGAGLAFMVVGKPKIGPAQILLGGLFLGAGIGGMHYIGMLAMRMEATLSFDPVIFAASVGVAVVISTLGLWLMTSFTNSQIAGRNMLVASLVGAAIPLMHYVGMAAARFSPNPASEHLGAHGDPSSLLIINMIVVVAILITSLPLFVASLLQPSSSALEVES